jgi:hypothetical protein
MGEKYIVTTYDKGEFISIIRHAFVEELKTLLRDYQNQIDQELLLNRKEAARFLKISIRTLSTYQNSGLIPHYKLGRGVYFKKGEIISALEGSDIDKYKHLKKL